MIKEELFGQDWIEEANCIYFKDVQIEDDEQAPKSQHYNTLNNLSYDDNHQVWKSLISRGKGQKMSFEEKLYIYSKLKSNKHNKANIMQKFWISYGTIMNIKKDINRGIVPWNERKILNSRQIINSRLLNKLIERYVWITKHPFTSLDVSTFLHKKHNIIISPWLIRKMLKID